MVPVIRLEHLTDAQARAFRIADNQIALNAGWDDALLGAELARLQEDGLDLDLLGFGAEDLDRLMAEVVAGETEQDPDAVSEPPVDPVTRPGDLWLLGDHRVLCGDATVLSDVEKALGGELADMCFTDPPYNVNYANSAKRSAETTS